MCLLFFMMFQSILGQTKELVKGEEMKTVGAASPLR